MTDQTADARRRQIIGAVLDVTAHGGLQSATFRTIAERAGVSVRLVQYYFGTKDQLLTDTLAHVGGQAVQRIQTALAELGPDPTPRQVITTVFEQFLPIDEERQRAMLVFIAFRTAALTDTALASSEKLGLGMSLVEHIDHEIQRAVAAKQAPPDIDTRSEAIILCGAMTSLANMMLTGDITVDDARRHLAYAVEGTLPSP